MEGWRGLDRLWRDQADEVRPGGGETLETLRSKQQYFSAIIAATVEANTTAITDTTTLHNKGKKAVDSIDAAFYRFVEIANEALAASREATAAGDLELAQRFQDQAEAAQAEAIDAQQTGRSIVGMLDAQLNAARAAREGGMVQLIQAGEQLAAALGGAGAGLEAAAARQGAETLLERAKREAIEVIGGAVGSLLGYAALAGAAFLAHKVLTKR